MLKRRITRVLAAASPLLIASLFVTSPVAAGTKWGANIVPPPVTYDAGVDGTGGERMPAIPACTSSPTSGWGICTAGASKGDVCTGVGATCDACDDPTPDGITAGDAIPANKGILAGKSKCQYGKGVVKASVAFECDTPEDKVCENVDSDQNLDNAGAPIGVCDDDNDFACAKDGHCKVKSCNGGDNAGEPCAVAGDCPNGTCDGAKIDIGPCLSGDEYWLQALLYVGSNADNTPACDPLCQASQVDPLGGDETCVVGVCDGGDRAGLPCDTFSGGVFVGGCGDLPAFCDTSGDGSGVITPQSDALADEMLVEVDAPPLNLTLRFLCPFEVGQDYPFEVKKGKGKVKAETGLTGAITPANVPVEVKGCFVHDQAGDEGGGTHAGNMSHVLRLGVFADPITSSAGKEPCPSYTTVVSQGNTGGIFSINAVSSPILGVSGVGGEVKCTADGNCKSGQFCCGGACSKVACP